MAVAEVSDAKSTINPYPSSDNLEQDRFLGDLTRARDWLIHLTSSQLIDSDGLRRNVCDQVKCEIAVFLTSDKLACSLLEDLRSDSNTAQTERTQVFRAVSEALLVGFEKMYGSNGAIKGMNEEEKKSIYRLLLIDIFNTLMWSKSYGPISEQKIHSNLIHYSVSVSSSSEIEGNCCATSAKLSAGWKARLIERLITTLGLFDNAGLRGILKTVAKLYLLRNLKHEDRPHISYDKTIKQWKLIEAGGIRIARSIIPPLLIKRFLNLSQDLIFARYTPQLNDTVVIVGAGIGEELYYISPQLGPAGKIVALEANERTFRCLRENCQQNRFHNVTPLHLAAASKDDFIIIQDLPGDRYLSNQIYRSNDCLSHQSGLQREQSVKAVRLDSFPEVTALSEIDCLYINIEGAEIDALNGMEETLRKTRNVSIECHDHRALKGDGLSMFTLAPIARTLRDAGFELSFNPQGEDICARSFVYGVNRRFKQSF